MNFDSEEKRGNQLSRKKKLPNYDFFMIENIPTQISVEKKASQLIIFFLSLSCFCSFVFALNQQTRKISYFSAKTYTNIYILIILLVVTIL